MKTIYLLIFLSGFGPLHAKSSLDHIGCKSLLKLFLNDYLPEPNIKKFKFSNKFNHSQKNNFFKFHKNYILENKIHTLKNLNSFAEKENYRIINLKPNDMKEFLLLAQNLTKPTLHEKTIYTLDNQQTGITTAFFPKSIKYVENIEGPWVYGLGLRHSTTLWPEDTPLNIIKSKVRSSLDKLKTVYVTLEGEKDLDRYYLNLLINFISDKKITEVDQEFKDDFFKLIKSIQSVNNKNKMAYELKQDKVNQLEILLKDLEKKSDQNKFKKGIKTLNNHLSKLKKIYQKKLKDLRSPTELENYTFNFMSRDNIHIKMKLINEKYHIISAYPYADNTLDILDPTEVKKAIDKIVIENYQDIKDLNAIINRFKSLIETVPDVSFSEFKSLLSNYFMNSKVYEFVPKGEIREFVLNLDDHDEFLVGHLFQAIDEIILKFFLLKDVENLPLLKRLFFEYITETDHFKKSMTNNNINVTKAFKNYQRIIAPKSYALGERYDDFLSTFPTRNPQKKKLQDFINHMVDNPYEISNIVESTKLIETTSKAGPKASTNQVNKSLLIIDMMNYIFDSPLRSIDILASMKLPLKNNLEATYDFDENKVVIKNTEGKIMAYFEM